MNTRDRLLAGLPVDDNRLELAGIATAVLEGGAGPPLSSCTVLESSLPYGAGDPRPGDEPSSDRS